MGTVVGVTVQCTAIEHSVDISRLYYSLCQPLLCYVGLQLVLSVRPPPNIDVGRDEKSNRVLVREQNKKNKI